MSHERKRYTRNSWLGIAILVLLMSSVAAACGDDGGEGGAADTPEITLIHGLRGDPFYVAVECGAKAAAERLGAELEITAPEKFDASLQARVVSGVEAKSPDAVAVAPADPVALYQPLKALADNGAKIVTFDGVLENEDIIEASIVADEIVGGQLGADEMAKLVNETGKVLIISDAPGNFIQADRVNGFKDQLEAKYPDMEVVGTEYTQGDTGKAAQAVGATLARESDLAGVYTTGGVEIEGAVSALRQAGPSAEIAHVGFAGGQAELEFMENDLLHIGIFSRARAQGENAIEQAVAAVRGEPVKRNIKLGYVVVTAENKDSPETAEVVEGTEC